MKVQRVPGQGYRHWCPACQTLHLIYCEEKAPDGRSYWMFNGSMSAPSFVPSVRISYHPRDRDIVCHYFLTDGVMKYCGDSTHELAGKGVPLPDIPPDASLR